MMNIYSEAVPLNRYFCPKETIDFCRRAE